MGRSERIRRGAVIGLALTLLALTALSLIGAFSTRRSAATVTRSAALADGYYRAHDAVAAEESLERKYRLEPGAEVLAGHQAAQRNLRAALADVQLRGTEPDRRLVATLFALHATYVTAIDRMFAAVDAGDAAAVLRIDNDEVDPSFERISNLVQAATDEHGAAAARAVADLHRVEGLVFITTTAGFAVGLLLLLTFGAVAVGYQRTVLRQATESQYQALHDSLTGLPNRILFSDRLDHALAASRRDNADVAIMLLDLDRFKEVNDTLGHHYGDELLRQVAARVGAALRTSDTVARLSGDEFAMLLPGTGADEALGLAERLLADLHRSFVLEDVTVDVEASVGVAVAPQHAGTAEALLRCGDIAMYAAKDSKTGAVLYQSEMHTGDAGRLSLLGDLRRALSGIGQLSLHYQPKVSLAYGELCGVEALVRWEHPTRGMISPADFIPIAETTGLINRLTSEVLRIAVTQARRWYDEGFEVPVAVNLSPRCLLDPSIVDFIIDLLTEVELPTSLLRLEVTETAVMANPTVAMATLGRLHDVGIRLSIDDYGTGYSSMAYLKRLPVDELKVDRTFVLNMTADADDAVLVRGAIDLGHNLGMTVVAEGVERPEHVAALRDYGCDIAQGFHFARPMPAPQATQWIRDHRLPTPSGRAARHAAD